MVESLPDHFCRNLDSSREMESIDQFWARVLELLSSQKQQVRSTYRPKKAAPQERVMKRTGEIEASNAMAPRRW
jgi:hypothetical protein